MRFDYRAAFIKILDQLEADQTIDVDELLVRPEFPQVSMSTKRNYLRLFIQGTPSYLQRVTGFYPSVETVIDVIESKFGPVSESRILDANNQCRELVERIGRPIMRRFVSDTLAPYIVDSNVSQSMDQLMKFLMDDFVEFQKGAGNGLVSIAGGVNEALLMRAMTNGGLVRGKDFEKTGKNSEGDFVVHSAVGNRDNLGVEVKSYHARERLLRGLRDITGLKVGVGYFQVASEFNVNRTVTLLQADPAAIYMPAATLSRVDPAAQAITTNNRVSFGARLYRPLENFVTDMTSFCKTGTLR